MTSEDDTNRKTLKKFTKDHWIAIAGILSGTLIALAIPIWQIYWIDSSDLSIEINSINRNISPNAGIALEDYPELKVLQQNMPSISTASLLFRRYLETDIESGDDIKPKGKSLSPVKLRTLFTDAQNEFKSLPEKIESQRKEVTDLDKLTPVSMTILQIQKLNRPLVNEVEIDKETFDANRKDFANNTDYFMTIIDQFKKKYQEKLQEHEDRYAELQVNLPLIERKIEVLTKELEDKYSFFQLSTVLLNSGRASTSVKKPALLRIYIGTGNYVDLKLKMQEYEKSSEVAEHSTSIANFFSEEISSLPIEDQKLINTYWGQSVQAMLFVEEISGSIVQSNSIAFSEGLYEKIIYDRLKGAASIIFEK